MLYIESMREAYKEGYAQYGIRTSYETLEVGENCSLSHDWDHENDIASESLLSGTSATKIAMGLELNINDEDDIQEIQELIDEAIKLNRVYPGKNTYLVAGNHYEYGEDPDEIILADDSILETRGAKVIAIIK